MTRDFGNKDNDGKLPYHLISPFALEQLAKVCQGGALKYGDRNWERGIQYSKILAALLRHVLEWWMGSNEDDESVMHPLAHVMWHCMVILHFEAINEQGLDDRPYQEEENDQ